jgi:hypothetical protein
LIIDRPNFHSRSSRVIRIGQVHSPSRHTAHRATDRDNEGSSDPAEWNSASYSDHPIDTLEPLPDYPNAYREAAIGCLKVLHAMDDFLTAADDKRAGWIAVAIVLKLTSTRGLSVADIAHQLGCSATTIGRYAARFASMINDGGLQSIQPGSKSNCADPVPVQA